MNAPPHITTNLTLDFVLPDDYEDLVQRFGVREIGLAYFGGLTYLQTQARYGEEALVMREV